jgi:hypothetical protein
MPDYLGCAAMPVAALPSADAEGDKSTAYNPSVEEAANTTGAVWLTASAGKNDSARLPSKRSQLDPRSREK